MLSRCTFFFLWSFLLLNWKCNQVQIAIEACHLWYCTDQLRMCLLKKKISPSMILYAYVPECNLSSMYLIQIVLPRSSYNLKLSEPEITCSNCLAWNWRNFRKAVIIVILKAQQIWPQQNIRKARSKKKKSVRIFLFLFIFYAFALGRPCIAQWWNQCQQDIKWRDINSLLKVHYRCILCSS